MSDRRITPADFGLVALGVLATAAAQVMLRLGASGLGERGVRDLAVSAARNPAVLAGLALYIVSAVAWMVVLSRIPLSVAYPLGSFTYVLMALAAIAMGETLSPARWAGVFFVVLGIILVGTGARA